MAQVVCICLVLPLLFTGCSSVRLDNTAQTIALYRDAPREFSKTAYPRRVDPDYPTFEELKSLIDNPHPGGALSEKLETFFKTPIIDNQAFYGGMRPTLARNAALGSYIRFGTWNIEKSLTMSQAIDAMVSADKYVAMIDPEKAPAGSKRRATMIRQRERLAEADIIVLQEMDIGVNRSAYLDAAGELARALNMNYAYGAQYLEIDPVLLGLQPLITNTKMSSGQFMDIDPSRYKGVFGSAILSKYPIKHVELFPLKTQPYDWYAGELEKFGPIEKTRRYSSKALFHNQIGRELKVGGRNFFRIDLEVPGLPENTLSVINIHLEIKCEPKARDAQIKEILSYIRNIDHPVIMAGDFNSAPNDISNTSAVKLTKKSITSPYVWTSAAINVGLAFGNYINTGRWALNTSKNFHSPLAWDIPFLLPNKTKPMFNRIERFRFEDGGAFDFRGSSKRSINGRNAKLSNSNQKEIKGQATSFSVKRPIGPIGLYRLDWIFVKPWQADRGDKDSPLRFTPNYGETLVPFNKYLLHPLSDHRPSVVDIQLD